MLVLEHFAMYFLSNPLMLIHALWAKCDALASGLGLKTLFSGNFTTLKVPHPAAESGTVVWFNILVFFAAWTSFYLLVLLLTRFDEETCCRIVTLCHGSLTTYLTLVDIFVNHNVFDFKHQQPVTNYQKYFLSFTLSYFLFDLSWIYIVGNETWVMYMHHVSSIFLLLKVLISDSGGPAISYGLAGLEFTNPYLQTRWFLRSLGYNHTPVHTCVELYFLLSFVVIRVVGGTVLLYYVTTHPALDLTIKFCFFLIYIVSWLLVWETVVFFRKKYLSPTGPLARRSRFKLFSYPRRQARYMVLLEILQVPRRYLQAVHRRLTRNND